MLAMALTESYRHVEAERADALAALAAARRLGLLRRRPPPPPAAEARLRGRLHSRGRDSAAISHHYDISNEMYRAMLGPTMVYSCAYYAAGHDTLDAAQTRKLDLICRKLELAAARPAARHRLRLGLAADPRAREYGARGVGVTISERQAELARERVREAGLGDRIEIRLQDYRDVGDGPYDKIASIGMFEHVGRGNLDALLRRRALAAGARRSVPQPRHRANSPEPTNARSFSRRYVFPDGELHTQAVVIAALEEAASSCATTSRCARTTRRRCATGAPTSTRGASRRSPRSAPSASASGAFTTPALLWRSSAATLSVHQVIAAPLELGATPPPLRVRSYPV